MAKVEKPRLIFDPILGLIDVTDILPLLDVPEFQSLGFKYQLGLTAAIFPSATHTRKQHSLGAYERTKRLASNWLNHKFINEDEALALQIYALYHDIGHGPFSHLTEGVGKINHKERGINIFESLENHLRSHGFNYGLIHDLMSHKNPLYLAVSDKNLGMEKLDYLERDAFYTIGERPGVAFVAQHTYFIDSKVVIDRVAVDQAKAIQDFYIKMSKNVYLGKKSAILQRLIEKMSLILLREGLSEKEFFELTDFGLLGRFEVSRNELVHFYYRNLMSNKLPRFALEFKFESVASADLAQKMLKIAALDNLDKLIASPVLNDFDELERLEKNIAQLAGIPAEALFVVPPFSKTRFEPEDIYVYSEGQVRRISEIYPSHFEAMKEYGRSHLSIRLGVFEEYRKKLYDQSDAVKNYFLSLI
ncbi:MAG: Metal dependent phosphohydrolase [Candidatus Jorgensenbacteria bacterium GW2011_GWA1_48_11]|uniref:Metal dependent phosphohydrolase n=1 Tax=Candidatus Jorgensenbacteria bacterium GW2011_GWA1_48_11 TaxID=1618660 RepID=A0A0G1X8W3_9BACT|nr:MAG: Metal dependent phosphohydrolase [Candidatus Jorgensenbacteria bacterium GW2011_GWA1_48_11]KKW12404.1 MAG: Metal dependent phosphohydrolase [Candidatus Jorgensenbacteria bacterium GW2011_GWB1_49_9]